MLFWLGSFEFDTPWGRFILTSALKACWGRRRPATKEEAAQVWSYLERRLWSASYDELLPLYRLYEETTSEPYYGPHGPPHLALVLDAVRHALWSNQVQFQFEAPFGPLLEVEWEPPPVQDLVKRIPSQSPSEIWGRRDSPPKRDVYFKVQFVDEAGQSIPDVQVTFTHAGHDESDVTNGSGVVEYAGTGESTASVNIESLDKLEAVLDKRWQALRPLKLLEGAEVSRFTLKNATQATTVTDAKTHTIQIVPQLGCIYLELVDKTNQVRHANCKYAITGPNAYAGVTDENGLLRHDDVLKGDYKLELAVDNETYDCDLVVLENEDQPQYRMVSAFPRSSMASVRGFVFEKNKAFVMPAAIESMQEVRALFFSTAPNEILIVGHADTTAEPPINDPLSLSRADCAQAMLLGDVDAWLKMYTTSVKEKHRWGGREDGLMIAAMPDYDTKPKSEGPVWWYQRTRGLKQDGDCGKNTRTQLITEYMRLVGEPLAKDSDFRSKLTTHGCGENFPLDATGENVDPNPANPMDDPGDRRVEFFLFDAEYGIDPPATTKNSQPGSTEYPKWREGAKPKYDFETPEAGMRVLKVRLHDDLWYPMDTSSAGGTDSSTQEVPYRVTIGTVQRPEKKAPGGRARLIVPELCLDPVLVEWGELDKDGNYPFQRRIFADSTTGTERQQAHARLSNLGYRFKVAIDAEYDLAVREFQRDYAVSDETGLVKGMLGKASKARLDEIYQDGDGTLPVAESVVGDAPIDTPVTPFDDSKPASGPAELKLQASGFVEGGVIDATHAGGSYGANKAPDLSWEPGPPETQAYAVLMHDPDADCVHWLVVDIPATATSSSSASGGGTACQNYLNHEYAGPCPPAGEVHKYALRIVALDQKGLVPTNRTIGAGEFDSLIESHVLGESSIASQFPQPAQTA